MVLGAQRAHIHSHAHFLLTSDTPPPAPEWPWPVSPLPTQPSLLPAFVAAPPQPLHGTPAMPGLVPLCRKLTE